MDNYKTIAFATSEILYKEKNSKFLGYGFPILSIDEVKPIMDNLRKNNFGAGHFCYAYQVGIEKIEFRTNDDGEPNNSAGIPIYGQILSCGVTNILIVIIRYFGGTKLGVGGLINAYKTAAQMVLETATIVTKNIYSHFSILFEYKNINKVMRIIKEKNLEIVSQKMELSCEIKVAVLLKDKNLILEIFDNLFEVEVKVV